MTNNLSDLSPESLLAYARAAGVSVTVDCQCSGLFVNGRQHCDDGVWKGNYLPPGPPPEGVPADLLAALTAHEGELVPMLEAAGQWSCGCTVGLTREQIAELDDDDDQLVGA